MLRFSDLGKAASWNVEVLRGNTLPITPVTLESAISTSTIVTWDQTMNANTTSVKFSYHIQPKEGGGFVAIPSDPALKTIEGSTKEEVEQKIQARISEMIEVELPMSLKLGGINVSVKPKINFTIRNKPNAVPGRADTTESPALGQNSAPIVPSDNGGQMLRVIAALIAVVALIYFFLHR